MNKLDAAKERLSISLEDIMSAITDARADVLEAVARGILIQSAMLWMRPQSRLIAAYSIEPPYGRVVEMRHGLDGVELHEKQFIIGFVESLLYRHPDATHRPFQLAWDNEINAFRWRKPLLPSVDGCM